MPITNVEDYQLALEAQSDPAVPPDAKAKLRASMEAFQRAQSGEVDLSALQDERDALDPDALVKTKPDKQIQFDVPAPRGPRVGSPGLPSHLGGRVEQRIDPSFNEFVRQNSAALGSLPDDVRAQVMELGTNSPEYQNWAQQQWESVADDADRQGKSVERLPAETFKTYEPDAGLGAQAGKIAGNVLDAGLAFSGGAADSGALAVPGAGTALSALGGQETASQWRQRQERHPVAATVGATLGALSPQNLVGLVARGGYGALSKAAGYVAPKAEGLTALAGRTAGSGLVGGGTAAAEGAVRDAVNQETFGEAPVPGAATRRFVEGAALGAGANLVGEGARAVHNATREAHPEIAGAEAGGVRPGIMGLKATEKSPARALEAQRAAQGDETLLNTAVKNAAPKVADAASAQNAEMLADSAAETAAIHNKLAVAGPPVPPLRPRNESKNAVPTLPPGPPDAEADMFGRIAREQGESQASLLGIEQAMKRGPQPIPPPTGTPLRVSAGPVAEEVVNILEQHSGPMGRELPFFNDNDLRKELPKLFDVQVLPLEEAATRAAQEGGWVQPLDRLVQTGIIPGAVPGSAGKVGYLKPAELDSRQFDDLVAQLQSKANLDTNLKPDPRYGRLAAAATKTRGEFPGLNELNAKQAERFTQHRERYEGAALRVGKNKEVPNYAETPHNDKAALLNALDQYKQAGRSTGAQARDQHFEAIAKAADPSVREALREIPMARSVDELRRTMSPKGIPGSRSGAVAQIGRSALVRLNPTLGALGSVPDIQALGEKLNPQLKDLLRQMRIKSSPSRVGVAALSGQIGLRGGVAGARAEQAIGEKRESDAITREDLENLLRLKRATQRATP